MLEFYHKSLSYALHLDWLQFGVRPLIPDVKGSPKLVVKRLLSWFGTLPSQFSSETSCRNPFYFKSFGGNGWNVYYDPKPGCNNPYVMIELRGTWFREWASQQADMTDCMLNLVYSSDCGIDLCRLDVAMDAFRPLSRGRLNITSPFMRTKWHGGKSSAGRSSTETVYCGFGDFQFKIYDKVQECIDHKRPDLVVDRPHWWRYEVRIKGKGLKNQFPTQVSQISYSDLLLLGVQVLGSDKVVVYPPWFQEVARSFISGDVVPYSRGNPTLEGCVELLTRKVSRLMRDSMSRIFQRYGDKITTQYYPSSDVPGDVEEYLNSKSSEPDSD